MQAIRKGHFKQDGIRGNTTFVDLHASEIPRPEDTEKPAPATIFEKIEFATRHPAQRAHGPVEIERSGDDAGLFAELSHVSAASKSSPLMHDTRAPRPRRVRRPSLPLAIVQHKIIYVVAGGILVAWIFGRNFLVADSGHGQPPSRDALFAEDAAKTAFELGNNCLRDIQAGNFVRAKKRCDLGLAKRPEEPEIRGALLFNLGQIAEKQGDAETAKTRYRESLAARPTGTNVKTVQAALDRLERR